MQHFYLQRSLTQAPVSLTSEEKATAKQNLEVFAVQLDEGAVPENGVPGARQTAATTVVGTVVGNGLLAVVLTSAAFSKVYLVPVLNNDTAAQVSGKIVNFVNADEAFTDELLRPDAGNLAIFHWKRSAPLANDPTMNISIAGAGTTVTGITPDATSAIVVEGLVPVLGTVGIPGQLADNGARTWVNVIDRENEDPVNIWREVVREDPANGFVLVANEDDGRDLSLTTLDLIPPP